MTISLNDITSGYSTGKINTNFQTIEDYLNQSVLSRDNVGVGQPNQMEVALDMNSNDIYNVSIIRAQDFQFDSINNQSIQELVDEAYNWAQHPVDTLVPEGNGTDEFSAFHHRTKADNAQTAAETAQTAAELAETNAAATLVEFQGTYWGQFATEPATNVNGETADAGDLYYNTTSKKMFVYTGTVWRALFDEAINITFTPAGDISATNVQAALEELDDEKTSRTSSTGATVLPSGTTAQRPTGQVGYLRHSSTLSALEAFIASAWRKLLADSGSTVINIAETEQSVTDGNVDASLGSIITMTLSASTILNITNWVDGQSLTFHIINGDANSVDWSTNHTIDWHGGVPVLSAQHTVMLEKNSAGTKGYNAGGYS